MTIRTYFRSYDSSPNLNLPSTRSARSLLLRFLLLGSLWRRVLKFEFDAKVVGNARHCALRRAHKVSPARRVAAGATAFRHCWPSHINPQPLRMSHRIVLNQNRIKSPFDVCVGAGRLPERSTYRLGAR